MSDDAEQERKKDGGRRGSPAWMATFADLMSLLMCFFVLLLSFSEMDVLKYKQVAGSMESAFGVQRIVESSAVPKGTSIIAQEFRPGKPDPTIIKRIQQITVDDTRQSVDYMEREKTQTYDEKIGQQTREIAELMIDEIKEGDVDIELKEGKIIIRIREHGSFPSGSDELAPSFLPIIEKIRMVLAETQGKVQVSGHTDNIPIKTRRFRSNWELSASRAVSVTHALLETGELDNMRFTVNGFANTEPLADNDTEKNRAKNRRVEIIITPPEENKDKKKDTGKDNVDKKTSQQSAIKEKTVYG